MIVLWLIACGKHPAEVPAALHLTVLHTNDLHGHFLPAPAEWLEGRPAIGGMVRLEQEVRAIREQRGEGSTLLLDGGDQLTGTPLTDIEEDGAIGRPMLRFIELLRYDAWALGNHEFDKGLANLGRYTALSPVPVLSSNVRDESGVAPLLPRQLYSTIVTRAGVRVGLIGATTMGLGGLMNPRDFSTLRLVDVTAAVREEARRLDPLTDLLVLVSHCGVEAEEAIARAVPELDLVVGGHSHTRLYQERLVGNVRVVQAGSYARLLGVVDLVVHGDAISQFHYELRELKPETATVGPAPEMQRLVERYAARIDAMYGEVIAQSDAILQRNYHHESTLGRWITDVLRATTDADVAIYNGGGLRADLAAGPVPRRAIFECFPFRNEVMVFHATGQELLELALRNAQAEHDEKRGFLPLSGLTYTWRVRTGAPEIVAAAVGGNAVEPGRLYVVATNSYIAEQWEKHLGFQPRELRAFGMSDYDAAVEFAAKNGVHEDRAARAVRVQ
jgi:2',3'-cyclic-nucleotide 2'-phosphodiesterase (5'-nucleotidase family)